ncbi:MAG TPA: flagellar biosynthesis protein FlhB [Fimbriimonas sp.]|nr:flagellar biosynthesis protein FlhB [Fimbriimonas sp.]
MGDGQERTEAATPRHRLEARKKGTVAQSRDLVNAATIITLLLVLPYAGSLLATGTISAMHDCLGSMPADTNPGHMGAFFVEATRPVLPGLCLIIGSLMVVAVAMNFAQVGFVLSGQALMPNFKKINPLTGFGRLFSRNSLFDTFKALFKMILFGLIAYMSIRGSWNELNSLDQLAPAQALSVIGAVLRTMGIRVALAWGVLAGVDYFFQRQQVDRQLRMTKEEVRREMREMEASPEMKAARNVRRRKLMRQRLKEAVASADVVVTNPTHYAVAIKYEPGKFHAPVVVAKGVDYLAAKIREEAAEAEVPIIPNPPLARALYRKCEVGDFIPRDLFQAVAEVLAHVYRILNKMPRY